MSAASEVGGVAIAGPELRTDPITGTKALIAPQRSHRPIDFVESRSQPDTKSECPFCEGHEAETPPELAALRPGGGRPDGPGWAVRVVPNKFPLLADGASGALGSADHLATSGLPAATDLTSAVPAKGAHEVIVHSPKHVTALIDLEFEQLDTAVSTWRQRMRAHADAAYVHLLVNEGASAGASLEHSHAQLLALGFVPALPARERERFEAHHRQTQGGCLLCDLVQQELRQSSRVVAADESFAIVAPFASQLPYQLQIVPLAHRARFESDDVPIGATLLHALTLLESALGRRPPLNIWVRSASRSAESYHWRIEIVPRLTHLAGVELGTGLAVNIVPPEQVAAQLAAQEV